MSQTPSTTMKEAFVTDRAGRLFTILYAAVLICFVVQTIIGIPDAMRSEETPAENATLVVLLVAVLIAAFGGRGAHTAGDEGMTLNWGLAFIFLLLFLSRELDIYLIPGLGIGLIGLVIIGALYLRLRDVNMTVATICLAGIVILVGAQAYDIHLDAVVRTDLPPPLNIRGFEEIIELYAALVITHALVLLPGWRGETEGTRKESGGARKESRITEDEVRGGNQNPSKRYSSKNPERSTPDSTTSSSNGVSIGFLYREKSS